MKVFNSAIVSAFLVIFMPNAHADNAVDMPPAHKQKHNVPDSTEHGNYLEPQDQSTGGGEQMKDGAVPGNAKEKSQRFKQQPEQGGTDVQQKKSK